MNQIRQYKTYPNTFKEEAIALVIDQGYTVPDAAQSLGTCANLLYDWKQL
jgi:transposase